jgi:D-3-phosphoglycerate dehydrogenase / 2-oxoglutarate reductase
MADDGHEVDVEPSLDADDLVERLDHDVLVVRSTRVTRTAIEACPRLSLVVRAGSGTNTIDTDAAADNGVYVSNVPGQNAIAVAELAIGLLASIDRRIPDNVADLRAGRWDKSTYQKARGLFGRRVGVVGLGDIGIEFASRAAGLGMEVVAIRREGRPPELRERIAELGIELVDDLESLVSSCEILSFHVPLNDDTRGLVDADLLALVRPGAILINTSRGEIVDEEALIAAMEDKGVRAGLDVYRDEPESGRGEFTSAVGQHPNVYGTHHIGASTEQAQEAIAAQVVGIVRDFAVGEVRNCVNLEQRVLGSSTLVVRHLDRVGVLSGVLTVLREAEINVEQMENRIFVGEHAASATIRVSGVVTDEVRARIQGVDDVIHLAVFANEAAG